GGGACMRKTLASGALLCLVQLLANCGDNNRNTPVDASIADAPTGDGPVDAMPDAPGTTCNPLAAAGQQGCPTGQKCTWLQVADTPNPLGRVDCVPDGNLSIGQACTQGAAGETTGYDDCVAGAICINAVCSDICGFDGSAAAACGVGEACVRYA